MVFRPGWVLGNSLSGYVPSNNHLLCLIKSCIQLAVAPKWEQNLFFLPVDNIANMIVNISKHAFSTNLKSSVFNLNNINSISWISLINILRAYGYHITLIPAELWYKKYIKTLNTDNALFPFKSIYATNTQFNRIKTPDPTCYAEKKNTLKILNSLNITMPQIDGEKLWEIYIDFLIRVDFLPKINNQLSRTA